MPKQPDNVAEARDRIPRVTGDLNKAPAERETVKAQIAVLLRGVLDALTPK